MHNSPVVTSRGPWIAQLARKWGERAYHRLRNRRRRQQAAS